MSELPSAIHYTAGLERVMGDQDMYLRVLTRFRLDYHDKALHLRAALAAGDLPLAQRIAHTLKGAAAMIEARALRQLAVEAEQQLRSGAGTGADARLLDRLDAELARVVAQADALLQAPAAQTVQVVEGVEALDAAQVERLCAMLDTGDSAALDMIDKQCAGLQALLGAPRMAALQAAVASFDFEGALQVLQPGYGQQPQR